MVRVSVLFSPVRSFAMFTMLHENQLVQLRTMVLDCVRLVLRNARNLARRRYDCAGDVCQRVQRPTDRRCGFAPAPKWERSRRTLPLRGFLCRADGRFCSTGSRMNCRRLRRCCFSVLRIDHWNFAPLPTGSSSCAALLSALSALFATEPLGHALSDNRAIESKKFDDVVTRALASEAVSFLRVRSKVVRLCWPRSGSQDAERKRKKRGKCKFTCTSGKTEVELRK